MPVRIQNLAAYHLITKGHQYDFKRKLIAEIEQIPDNKIAEIYDLIHYFRLGLAEEKSKTAQKPEEIFKLLTALTDDFMINGREQLPLQIREDF